MKKMVLKRCPTCNGKGKIGWIFKKICPTCHGFGKFNMTERPKVPPSPQAIPKSEDVVVVREENDNTGALLTGVLIGSILSDHSEPSEPSPEPVEGHGGEFGGGGATGEWEESTPASEPAEPDSNDFNSDSGGGDSGGGE